MRFLSDLMFKKPLVSVSKNSYIFFMDQRQLSGFGYPGEELGDHGSLEPLGKQRLGNGRDPGPETSGRGEEAHDQV